MQINSIQLTSHLEVLLSQSALWVGSYEELKSGLIRNLCNSIIATVRKLGSQLVLFLQVGSDYADIVGTCDFYLSEKDQQVTHIFCVTE